MNGVLGIVLNIVGGLFTVIFLLYYFRMFQQNSYKADRFLRWYFHNGHQDALKLTKKYKVKFVVTARVDRLAATTIILLVLIYTFAWPFGFLTVLVSPAIMLLANLANTPMEKLVGRWYYNDAKRKLNNNNNLIIIGVTGSFGKTSTKNYLYRILSEQYNVLVTPGNYNTLFGVIRTIREQLKPQHQVFIVEMGAKQTGDIKEICDLVHPSIGIVTAVGKMHLETFKTFEAIQNTKFELIRSLPSDGLGVINYSSDGISSYKNIPDHCKVVRYMLPELGYSSEGTTFSFNGEQYQTKLLGAGNILDILGALTVADYLGVPVARQKIAVSKLQCVEHRLSLSRRGGLTIIDDAYNSNPVGAAMALDVLSRMAQDGRRIVITPGFVELGSAAYESGVNFGKQIAASAEYLIIVNKLNRDSILEGALAGGMDKDAIICVDDLNTAVACLGALAKPGDTVLYENDLPDTFK